MIAIKTHRVELLHKAGRVPHLLIKDIKNKSLRVKRFIPEKPDTVLKTGLNVWWIEGPIYKTLSDHHCDA